MDFYHFRPSCKVIKRSRLIKSPILTNFENEKINNIFEYEKFHIQEGKLNLQHLGIFSKYSRKVFVGGLPRHMSEEIIISIFSKFGRLKVDWPYKENTAKAVVPPKGFVFLLFEDDASVNHLLNNCQKEDEEYFIVIPRYKNKELRAQVRPWKLIGVDHFFVPLSQMNTRLTIFVGGVPRTLNAEQIGQIMSKLFGEVAYVGIDIDSIYLYPKGSARVIFLNKCSLVSAVKKRFVMPTEVDQFTRKMMEIKPYVLDDQTCDRCDSKNLMGMPVSTLFCPETQCLSYLCEFCWIEVHSQVNSRIHKPMVKQGRNDYANSLTKRGFDPDE